ncbi:Rieske 2Fe-2S domain-containing protein [Terripilifer ovatus]|uniref:Rieske 2Fe-2S domain-containing protein n=1 Tax=Terripilifer ovatus TaxID=3032367 RepID=UPI003AB9AE57
MSAEVPPNGAPQHVRILGEDLVLFRDDSGRPGLLGLKCAHRCADLSYGRVDGCSRGRVAECRVIETLADHSLCVHDHA